MVNITRYNGKIPTADLDSYTTYLKDFEDAPSEGEVPELVPDFEDPEILALTAPETLQYCVQQERQIGQVLRTITSRLFDPWLYRFYTVEDVNSWSVTLNKVHDLRWKFRTGEALRCAIHLSRDIRHSYENIERRIMLEQYAQLLFNEWTTTDVVDYYASLLYEVVDELCSNEPRPHHKAFLDWVHDSLREIEKAMCTIR